MKHRTRIVVTTFMWLIIFVSSNEGKPDESGHYEQGKPDESGHYEQGKPDESGHYEPGFPLAKGNVGLTDFVPEDTLRRRLVVTTFIWLGVLRGPTWENPINRVTTSRDEERATSRNPNITSRS